MSALSATARPEELVPGDEEGLDELAATMRRYRNGCADAAGTLRAIDDGAWVGEAADVFRTHVEELPRKLESAASAFGEASRVVDAFVSELARQRQQARRAIDLFASAEQSTHRWQQSRADHRVAVDRYRAAHPESLVDPVDAGLLPAPSVHDPGAPDRARAETILGEARADVEFAAGRAARALEHAAELAPDEPGLLRKAAGQVGQFFLGAGEALYGLAEFAFKLSPVYMVVDPDGYIENAVALGKGLAYGLQHPKEFGKALLDWDTWAENPARALGHLVPDLLLALATGGAGTVAARASRAGKVVDDLASAGTGLNRMSDASGTQRASWARQFGNPAHKAASDQRAGKYNGVDEWAQGWVEPGARFNGGTPGPSRYVAPDHVIADVGHDGQRYWEGLQVSSYVPPGAAASHRPGLATYEVGRAMPVGVSVATHNPQFGPGGLPQYFLPADIQALKAHGYITEVRRVPLTPKPPVIQPSGLPGVDPLTSLSHGEQLARGTVGAAAGIGAQGLADLQNPNR